MDRDPILQFSASHYPTIADPVPVRIHIPHNGSTGSPPPEEISEPSDGKLPRLHILASGNGAHYPEESRPKQSVRYRECQKNHAANIGGHALDGCGEFLPSGKEGTMESLKCAACSCHRNFHRREVEGEYICTCNQFRRDLKTSGLSGPPTPALLALPSSREIVSHAQMVMSLSSPPTHSDGQDASQLHPGSSRKKRHRTKFTAEQKEKMTYFAEDLGWKIAKNNEDAIMDFCNDVGVNRNVFKVWMHNNKHNGSKKMDDGVDPMKNCESPSDF